LLITMGDVAGIGTEVLALAWAETHRTEHSFILDEPPRPASAGGFPLVGQAGGFTEARRKFDDCIARLDVQSLDHPVCQLSPARTEDSFSPACQ
jgi:hypothetical protein